MQLQDGTTYDSINIVHHNYMKSTKNLSEKYKAIRYNRYIDSIICRGDKNDRYYELDAKFFADIK